MKGAAALAKLHVGMKFKLPKLPDFDSRKTILRCAKYNKTLKNVFVFYNIKSFIIKYLIHKLTKSD
jgi:hypothetical protein